MSAVAASDGPDLGAWPPMAGVTTAWGPALVDLAADGSPDRSRVCLIRGARGSGKSHLLAWFLSGSAASPRTTVHAAIPAAGLFADAFAWELGRQLGYGPLSPDQVVDRLAADRRPLLLLVPDLHHAGRGPADRPPARPATLVQEILLPLLALPQVRAIVEVGDTGLLDAWTDAASIDLGDKPYRSTYVPDGTAAPTEAAEPGADVREDPPRWDQAPADVREHALDRALSAADAHHKVRRLLSDPGFLLYGSPVSIAACLADERLPAPPGLRATWALAAPQLSDTGHDATQRAVLLHTAALGTSPHLARYLAPLTASSPFSTVWARPELALSAIAPVPGAPGRLVGGEVTRGLLLLDASSGETTAAFPTPAASARPRGIAVRSDQSMLLLTDTGALHALTTDAGNARAATDGILSRIAVHHGHAALKDPDRQPTALGQCLGTGTLVIGDQHGSIHVWDTASEQAPPQTRTLHAAPITAVTCLKTPDGQQTLVMSAAMDGAVRLWAVSADPMPDPVEQRPAFVTAMCAANTAHGPILAVAWDNARLHLWHIPTGRVRRIPLLTRSQALAFATESRLVIAGPEGTYAMEVDTSRLWD